MKTNVKKALLLTVCALVLVVATVFATVAYFTSKASVANSFTVGKISVTLDEQKVESDGTPSTPASRIKTGNNYKLVPSATYVKDPIVHVEAGSESAYLFVKVENGISAIEAAETDKNKKIATQITSNGWTALPSVAGVYYKEYDAKNPVADHPVFGYFTVSDKETQTSLASYSTAKINVTAYAIQKQGIKTAADAWTELNK